MTLYVYKCCSGIIAVRAVLHEPPRRVLAPLPNSPIFVSDYLFPGEGPADSLTSLADLLDLGSLLEGDVQVLSIDFSCLMELLFDSCF